MMQRLNRAGRKRAVIDAIKRLDRSKKHMAYTRGEICRKMGILSSSKMRDLLDEMVCDGQLKSGSFPSDNYGHEITVYNIATYEQMPLPDERFIVINGESVRASW